MQDLYHQPYLQPLLIPNPESSQVKKLYIVLLHSSLNSHLKPTVPKVWGVRPGAAEKLKPSTLQAKSSEALTQRLHHPSIKEYALNHIRDPTMI